MEQVKCEMADEEDLDAEARVAGTRLGYVWCVRDGDRLKISDLHVVNAYRRQGIGTRLLRLVLAAADEFGIGAVWGLVTEDDLGCWPELIDWYQHLGFSVTEPDASDKQDVPGAMKRILRRR